MINNLERKSSNWAVMHFNMGREIENTKSLIINMIKCYAQNDYSSIEKILISEKIDWGFFCEKVIKNKLENLAWIVFIKCSNFEDLVPFYIREFFAKMYYINKERISVYYNNFDKICNELNDNGINYAVVKGISLERDLYGEDFVKRISDVDMLIHRVDAARVYKLFKDIGLCTGRFNYYSNIVEPLTREKQLFYKTTSDHLPEHFYFTSEKICPFLKIDVSTSFDWLNRQDDYLMINFLNENVVSKNIDEKYCIMTLEPVAHFIYLLNHFHRHAWSYRFITRNISIRLCMTNDIYMYWIKYGEKIKRCFGNLELDMNGKERISWTLYYIDQLYNCNIQRDLNLESYMTNVNCAFGKNNTIVRWNGFIEDRIWACNEIELFHSV